MSVFEKLDFLCKNENTLKYFFEFSFIIDQNPWCADGKHHSFEWWNGACADIKFLIPIRQEMKKEISFKEKKILHDSLPKTPYFVWKYVYDRYDVYDRCIYENFTFEQSKFKKDFVVMNQKSSQKATSSVEKDFWNWL